MECRVELEEDTVVLDLVDKDLVLFLLRLERIRGHNAVAAHQRRATFREIFKDEIEILTLAEKVSAFYVVGPHILEMLYFFQEKHEAKDVLVVGMTHLLVHGREVGVQLLHDLSGWQGMKQNVLQLVRNLVNRNVPLQKPRGNASFLT